MWFCILFLTIFKQIISFYLTLYVFNELKLLNYYTITWFLLVLNFGEGNPPKNQNKKRISLSSKKYGSGALLGGTGIDHHF